MPGSYQICEYIKKQGLKLFISPNLWVTEATKYDYPHEEIYRLLHIADSIIVNSNLEMKNLSKVYDINQASFRILYNGVEDAFFDSVDSSIFLKEYQLSNKKYLLNIANIEERKNQLRIIEAIKSFPDLVLVVIGNIRDLNYAELCRKNGGEQFIHLGTLPYASEILRSAIAGSTAFVLPSLIETPGIAALESAASGKSILVTENGCAKEYFGDLVHYADPYSVESIRIGIGSLVKDNINRSLQDHIANNFTWKKSAKLLLSFYEESLN